MTIATGSPKTLIPPDLYERLTSRIAREHRMDLRQASVVLDDALAFLVACVDHPGKTPTPQQDIGWHTFILHTREYAAFCDRIAGRFIHHETLDVGDCITCEEGGPPCQNPPPR